VRVRSLFLLANSALASSPLLVKCSSTTCKVSVIAFFPDDLSRTPYRCPHTQATRQQRTNKLGRCYQPERPLCTLARYSLPIRTVPFTYMCLSAQVRGGKRTCTLVAGTQDVPLMGSEHRHQVYEIPLSDRPPELSGAGHRVIANSILLPACTTQGHSSRVSKYMFHLPQYTG